MTTMSIEGPSEQTPVPTDDQIVTSMLCNVPGATTPRIEDFIRHAERFGTEGVFEAAEVFLHESALARLRIELDAIEAGRKRGQFTVGKRRRRGQAETRQAVLALSVDGLVPTAIADKLGLADRTVKEHLRAIGATAM